MKILTIIILFLQQGSYCDSYAQSENYVVSDSIMKSVYHEISTPDKFGLVLVPPDNSLEFDCPSVFKKGNRWYMTYIVFDGKGYETWIAKSKDLLRWKTLGRILSFSDSTDWDSNQKAGYAALEDYHWGGSYKLQHYDGKYWMSYIGGIKEGTKQAYCLLESPTRRKIRLSHMNGGAGKPSIIY